MSANSIAMTNKTPLYDFTNNLSKFFGGDAKQVNTGIYGLYAGDINANGQINIMVPEMTGHLYYLFRGDQLAIINGYYKEDVNMNGQVRYNGSGNDRSVILSVLGGNQLGVKNSSVP